MATSRFNLPLVGPNKPPAGNIQIDALAQAMSDNIAKGQAFTPTFTGITASAGTTVNGYWIDLGSLVWFQANYMWTTGVPTLGADLTVSTPTTIAAGQTGRISGALGQGGVGGGDERVVHGLKWTENSFAIKGVRASDGVLVNNLGQSGAGITLAANGRLQISGLYRKG